MPAKRSLWAKGTVNFNYLISTIHLWASRVIPLARASETTAEKRDSANLSINRYLIVMITRCMLKFDDI
jgi:hypothetical protein